MNDEQLKNAINTLFSSLVPPYLQHTRIKIDLK